MEESKEPKKSLADRMQESAEHFGPSRGDRARNLQKENQESKDPKDPEKPLAQRMEEGARHFSSPHDDQKRELSRKLKNEEVPRAMTAAERDRVLKERNNGPGQL
jgi:hypothetical protein